MIMKDDVKKVKLQNGMDLYVHTNKFGFFSE